MKKLKVDVVFDIFAMKRIVYSTRSKLQNTIAITSSVCSTPEHVFGIGKNYRVAGRHVEIVRTIPVVEVSYF